MAEPGQHLVTGGPDEQDGEPAAFVHEDDGLIAVEVGLPGERVGQRARLGAGMQLVLPVNVGDPAGTAAGHRGAQRAGHPPGPAGGVDDQVGGDVGAVDLEAGGPSAPLPDAVDVALAHLKAGLLQRGRPQRALERLPAGAHAHGHLGAARQVSAIGSAPASSHRDMASGSSCSSAWTTCVRKPCAWWNCMTPRRAQRAPSSGPGSRSTAITWCPRRASPAPMNRPAGPSPMMAILMLITAFGILVMRSLHQ